MLEGNTSIAMKEVYMSAYKTTDNGITGGSARIAWLAMAVLVSWAGCSLAADPIPNLTGTWKGSLQSVGSGQRTHAKPIAQATFVAVNLTIRIKRQKGRVFYGIKQSNRASEQLVGMVGPDKTVYLADEDGYQAGDLLAPNKLELVYLEAGQMSRVAGYIVYKRVR
jgi:hypothetical protein